MFINSNDRLVLETLKNKNLYWLRKPYKQLLEMIWLKKIPPIHKMTYKVIMRTIHKGTRAEIKTEIISHLVKNGIEVTEKKYIDKKSVLRVQKHRKLKKDQLRTRFKRRSLQAV